MILDAFDARILTEIQADSTTAAAIAQRVNLSTSAVTKRISRMRRSGLIARTIAVLDLRRIGPSVSMLALVSLDPDGAAAREAFVDYVQERTEVTNVLLLAGDVGVAVVVRTRTLQQATDAIRSLQEGFPQTRSVREYVVLGQPKRSLAVPFSLAGLQLADFP